MLAIAFLLPLVAGASLTVSTQLPSGEVVAAVRGGRVQRQWHRDPHSFATCADSLQFTETDFIRTREFVFHANSSRTVSVEATAGHLPLALSAREVAVGEGEDGRVSVEYLCSDFTEGKHRVKVKVDVGQEALTLFYWKLCGRPKTTDYDFSFLVVTVWGYILAVSARLLPAPQRQLSLRLTARTIAELAVAGGLLCFLLGLYISLALIALALYSVARELLLCIPVLRRGVRALQFNATLADVLAAVVAFAVSMSVRSSHFWMLSNAVLTVCLLAAVRYCKVDCVECCALLLGGAFVATVVSVCYLPWLSLEDWSLLQLQYPRRSQLHYSCRCTSSNLSNYLLPAIVLDFASRSERESTQRSWWLVGAYTFSLCLRSLVFMCLDLLIPTYLVVSPLLLCAGTAALAMKGEVEAVRLTQT